MIYLELLKGLNLPTQIIIGLVVSILILWYGWKLLGLFNWSEKELPQPSSIVEEFKDNFLYGD